MDLSSTVRLGLRIWGGIGRSGQDRHCKKPVLGVGVGNWCWRDM